MQIGNFRETSDGFEGRIRTLALDVPLRIVPAEPGIDKAPDWRLHLDDNGAPGPEVGAGWNHTGGKAGTFIAVQFDCPTLPRPIRANLLRSKHHDDVHVLLWSPRLRRPMAE